MGIGKTQKGLPVPPRLPHRFTGSPENFCGALLNAPTDTPTRANERNPAKKRSPYSPDRRGTHGTHYQVGDIKSYLFNNITFYSLFLQSPHKCFPVPPASCRPASGLDVSKEASPADTMTSPAGHAPTGLPLRLSPTKVRDAGRQNTFSPETSPSGRILIAPRCSPRPFCRTVFPATPNAAAARQIAPSRPSNKKRFELRMIREKRKSFGKASLFRPCRLTSFGEPHIFAL